MPGYTLSSQAEQDVDAIAAFLSGASLDAALRFYDSVAATFGTLAETPHLGRARPCAEPALAGLRAWRVDGFPSLLVFYVPQETGVRIMRVMHGARDIDAELPGPPPATTGGE